MDNNADRQNFFSSIAEERSLHRTQTAFPLLTTVQLNDRTVFAATL
jgi:hypothetical protein